MSQFIMAGIYSNWDGSKTFEIVAPSSGQPYVTTKDDGSLFKMCQHHSHMYVLEDDGWTARLHKKGSFRVPAPEVVSLRGEQVKDIKGSKNIID